MNADTAEFRALEQRVADLEAEIRDFRLDTILEVAGIAFSAGRESITGPRSPGPSPFRRKPQADRPQHLQLVERGQQ